MSQLVLSELTEAQQNHAGHSAGQSTTEVGSYLIVCCCLISCNLSACYYGLQQLNDLTLSGILCIYLIILYHKELQIQAMRKEEDEERVDGEEKEEDEEEEEEAPDPGLPWVRARGAFARRHTRHAPRAPKSQRVPKQRKIFFQL